MTSSYTAGLDMLCSLSHSTDAQTTQEVEGAIGRSSACILAKVQCAVGFKLERYKNTIT